MTALPLLELNDLINLFLGDIDEVTKKWIQHENIYTYYFLVVLGIDHLLVNL